MSPYAKFIANAPCAVILLANGERCRFPENSHQDMSAATENLLLEAVHLGLGATWLGVAPLKEREDFIRDLFKLPGNLTPFCAIPVG